MEDYLIQRVCFWMQNLVNTQFSCSVELNTAKANRWICLRTGDVSFTVNNKFKVLPLTWDKETDVLGWICLLQNTYTHCHEIAVDLKIAGLQLSHWKLPAKMTTGWLGQEKTKSITEHRGLMNFVKRPNEMNFRYNCTNPGINEDKHYIIPLKIFFKICVKYLKNLNKFLFLILNPIKTWKSKKELPLFDFCISF